MFKTLIKTSKALNMSQLIEVLNFSFFPISVVVRHVYVYVQCVVLWLPACMNLFETFYSSQTIKPQKTFFSEENKP